MINIIALIGPSGSGKTTLQSLMGVPSIVTWTSRKPRNGEINGVNYHFTNEENIKHMMDREKLLEFTNYNGNYYGTSIDSITSLIAERKIASVVVDSNGAIKLKEMFIDNLIIIGIYAPYDQCKIQLETREDLYNKSRLLTYPEEIEQMKKLADIIVNNSIDNWARSRKTIELIVNGIKRSI